MSSTLSHLSHLIFAYVVTAEGKASSKEAHVFSQP